LSISTKSFTSRTIQGDHFLEGLIYDFISDDDAYDLLREFSEEEVWKAINDLG